MVDQASTSSAGLLAEVLAAYGGLDAWRGTTAIVVRGRFRGLLRSRFPGNRLADLDVRVEPARQRAVLRGFPRDDLQGVFDEDVVRIETRDGALVRERRNPRGAFSGAGGVRRNRRWDALDATYFGGYALWNYLTTPLLLTHDGVTATEGATWVEGGEEWRRLEVVVPPGIHTHCARQTFYVDRAGLIRRHDYVAEVVGRWTRAANYNEQHVSTGGLVFARRHRVVPRGIGGFSFGGRSLPAPVMVDLVFDDIEIER